VGAAVVAGGREFTAGVIARIGARVRAGGLTRAALSREVCDWLGWRDAMGRQEMSCRRALQRLEQAGRIEVPAARARAGCPRAGAGAGSPVSGFDARSTRSDRAPITVVDS
jgi:hypothetical protein